MKRTWSQVASINPQWNEWYEASYEILENLEETIRICYEIRKEIYLLDYELRYRIRKNLEKIQQINLNIQIFASELNALLGNMD